MSASGAASTPRRLRILDDEELEALYGRPRFSAEERAEYFALTPIEQELLRSVQGLSSQVAFLLQLGYFKAKQLFFAVRFEEVVDDVSFLLARYFPQASRTDLRPPNKRTLLRQHRLLLRLFGYRTCTAREWVQLALRASQAARLSSKPAYVFRELLQYLTE